ncbi:hypothetical protein tb265_50070 [Gemmatimonadetes bacterium T265]|nr:hypothetical protein tb265_50070 [Gemmatimonadetes bacterium T265]
MGLAVVGCVLVMGRGVPTWWRWVSEHRAAAGELQAAVARARADVHDAAGHRDRIRAWERRAQDEEATLLVSGSAATAGPALAERMGALATAAGVQLGPVELRAATPLLAAPTAAMTTVATPRGRTTGDHRPCPSPGTCAAHLFRVTARTDVTGDVRGLASFLAALERSDGRLAVRELTVTQPEPGAAPTRAETLHAALVVEALVTTGVAAGHSLGVLVLGGERAQ